MCVASEDHQRFFSHDPPVLADGCMLNAPGFRIGLGVAHLAMARNTENRRGFEGFQPMVGIAFHNRTYAKGSGRIRPCGRI